MDFTGCSVLASNRSMLERPRLTARYRPVGSKAGVTAPSTSAMAGSSTAARRHVVVSQTTAAPLHAPAAGHPPSVLNAAPAMKDVAGNSLPALSSWRSLNVATVVADFVSTT